MPGTLTFAIIFMVIAAAVMAANKFVKKGIKKEEDREDGPPSKASTVSDGYGGRVSQPTKYAKDLSLRTTLTWTTRGIMGLAVLMLLIGSITMIPTKKIGVVTTFGAPSGSFGNGLHFIAPWQKVTTLDGAIQTDNFVNDEKTKENESTKIRLGNQSTANVGNSTRWRIKPGRADSLYRDYRDFDNIRDSLVTREKNAALNEVFKDYDPLSTVKAAADGKDAAKQATLKELGDAVAVKLREQVGDDIEILNVIIPLIEFDGETQGRINAYQAEIANTRIAEQRKQTAIKTAEANRELSSSVNNDPNVLVSKCFDALETMIKEKQSVPAGLNCWPGSGSTLALSTRNK